MDPVQLNAVALSDPFMKDYTKQYLLMIGESQATHGIYSLAYLGKEIKDISEYLLLTEVYHIQTVVHWVNTNFLSSVIMRRTLEKLVREFRNEDGEVITVQSQTCTLICL